MRDKLKKITGDGSSWAGAGFLTLAASVYPDFPWLTAWLALCGLLAVVLPGGGKQQ